MEFIVREHVVHIVVVGVPGRLDAYQAPRLRECLHGYLDAGRKFLVVDLSATPFMDSTGMGVLVTSLKRARQQAGDVVLVCPRSAPARRIIELARFDRVFKLVDEPSAAFAHFDLAQELAQDAARS